MKYFSSIVILICCAISVMAQTPRELMQRGNAFYQKGDYQNAAKAYEDVLNGGFQSVDVYYNLGNTYYRMDEFGQAILNYERALRLKPNFRDARENLDLAESKTEDHIAPLPEIFLARWARSVVSWFSPTGWRVVLLCVLVLLGAMIVLFALCRDHGWRKSSLIGSGIVTILLLLCLTCTIASHVRYNRHNDAVITAAMSVVKSSPESSGVDKFVLHEGSKVHIQETLGDWHKVHIADGNTGWIENSDITII